MVSELEEKTKIADKVQNSRQQWGDGGRPLFRTSSVTVIQGRYHFRFWVVLGTVYTTSSKIILIVRRAYHLPWYILWKAKISKCVACWNCGDFTPQSDTRLILTY